MKLKNLVTSSLFILAPLLAQAQSTQSYVGTSTHSLNGSRKCEVKLILNNQKQIIAIENSGPLKQWEIISENPSGYGPAGNIRFESNDELLSDPETFARLGFQRSSHIFSEGYSLKSSSTTDGFKATFKLDFTIKNSKLVAFKKTTKFNAAVVVPLATSSFECNDLSKN